jgi:hypothetical protein
VEIALRALFPLRVLLFLLGLLLFTGFAPQRASAENLEEARTLFVAGLSASREGRWEEARALFERSAAIIPKASTLFNLAVVEVELGLAEKALETLNAFDRLATEDEHKPLRERAEALRRAVEAELDRKKPSQGLPELLVLTLEEREAAALFSAGREAYAAGRYPRALEYFDRAYELSGQPELLYNVAAAADRLRDDERALEVLTAFLEAATDSPLRHAVTARVEVLKRVLAERSAEARAARSTLATEHTSAPEPAPVAGRDARRRRAWLTLGAGVLGAGGSVGAFFWWRDRDRNVERCGDRGELCENTDRLHRQRKAALATGLVLSAASVALLISGTVLTIKANERRSPASVRVHANGLSFSQAF